MAGGLIDVSSSGSAAAARRLGDVQRQLREGTADLHAAVEAAVDLPSAVTSRQDYIHLLHRFYDLHTAFEARWDAPGWDRSWAAVGIELDQHRRAPSLAADLVELGEAPPTATAVAHMPALATWADGLGSLYVLEGSSLGGRILGPAVRAALGPVPTAFFDSAGRGHPSSWRSVTRALARFEDQGGHADDLVPGARETFAVFGEHLARTRLPGRR